MTTSTRLVFRIRKNQRTHTRTVRQSVSVFGENVRARCGEKFVFTVILYCTSTLHENRLCLLSYSHLSSEGQLTTHIHPLM